MHTVMKLTYKQPTDLRHVFIVGFDDVHVLDGVLF